MLKLLMESSGDEAMGEEGERFPPHHPLPPLSASRYVTLHRMTCCRFGYYEKGTMEDDFVCKLGGKVAEALSRCHERHLTAVAGGSYCIR
jgi:hypothetical protein